MRILLHDFSGHPFQAELARSLAGRGHDVLHVRCASYVSGKGAFGTDGPGDPPPGGAGGALRFASISLGSPFARYSVVRRLAQELTYGARFVRLARRSGADVVISCNDPLLAKALFGAWATLARMPWVFWLCHTWSARAASLRFALPAAAWPLLISSSVARPPLSRAATHTAYQ